MDRDRGGTSLLFPVEHSAKTGCSLNGKLAPSLSKASSSVRHEQLVDKIARRRTVRRPNDIARFMYLLDLACRERLFNVKKEGLAGANADISADLYKLYDNTSQMYKINNP